MNLLSMLDLRRCRLAGTIPDLSGCRALTLLNLSENSLTGSIEPWIGRCAMLTELYLSKNQLAGLLPKEMGDLTQLKYCRLCDNRGLTGRVPDALLAAGGAKLRTFDTTNTQINHHLIFKSHGSCQTWVIN